MSIAEKKIWRSGLLLLGFVALVGWAGLTARAAGPEPADWYVGDMHVHRSCGGAPVPVSTIYDAMVAKDLAVVSLLADMGNGEVLDPVTDLPKVNGLDDPISLPGERLVHWDAEWHWDATYTQFEHQALGGHIVALGLSEAYQIWEEHTYPILEWAHQQNGIAGFAHMQYLGSGFPQSLNCCIPIEYPVEVALGAADFISEDVAGSDSAMQAYYRLLNTGFRPGFAAGSDYPCSADIGDLVTYVQIPGEPLTYQKWIEGIAAGRTVVSRNGHDEFLELKVNNSLTPGDELELTGPGTVDVDIQWTSQSNPSGTIELVHNGVVVASEPASVASLSATVDFTKSGWLAARRMSGRGHEVQTGAVFVTVDGAPVRASVEDAEFYVQWMDNLLLRTAPGGEWGDFFVESRDEARARYQAAKSIYEQIAVEAGSTPGALSITTGSLPAGIVDEVYSATLASSGGTEPYSWSIADGALSTGLTLDSAAGIISGTPTTDGTFVFTAQVSDAATPAQTASKSLSLIVAPAGTSTYTIWDSTATPTVLADPDTSPVEVGVKFRADVDGLITGIRFYKSTQNVGAHVGNLWDSSGNRLATATFSNETASGWQQVSFADRVPITAGTVYVASYHAPNGRYSVDDGYFSSTYTNGPLSALSDGESGGNGVYLYGSGGFPSNTYQASNYWVDVVLTTGGTPGTDTTLPTVAMTAPADGATVSGAVTVSADASDDVGVTSVQFLLDGVAFGSSGLPDTNGNYSITWDSTTAADGAHTLSAQASDAAGNTATATDVTVRVANGGGTDTTLPTVAMTAPADGATVSGAVTVSADASDDVGVTSVQFLLDGVAFGSSGLPDTNGNYSITWDSTTAADGAHTLSAQASDAAGNTATATDVTVRVANGGNTTSIWPDAAIPAVVADPDTSAVELGVKFQSDVNGFITGIRFYKSDTNTGPHVGSLWTTGGTRLAQASFLNETASGWQQVSFADRVPITAGTVYVASYHTNVGQYSVDEGYFASAYTNGPLRALQDGENGGNGVYRYSNASRFPNRTYGASNYWVDVVFTDQ